MTTLRSRYLVAIVTAVLVTTLICAASAQDPICSGDVIGPDVIYRPGHVTPNVNDEAFLAVTKGTIHCHGVIERWEIWVQASVACHPITMQVWRPVGGAAGTYVLIGQNVLQPSFWDAYCPVITTLAPTTVDTTLPDTTTPAITQATTPAQPVTTQILTTDDVSASDASVTDVTGSTFTDVQQTGTTYIQTVIVDDTTTVQPTTDQTTVAPTTAVVTTKPPDYGELISFPIPASDRLLVQPGDVYGWVDRGNTVGVTDTRLLAYDEGLPNLGQVLILRSASCPLTVGKECAWLPGTVSMATTRDYSVKAFLSQGEIPYFINLPVRLSMDENNEPGSFLYRVEGYNRFTSLDIVPPDLVYAIVGIKGRSCKVEDFAINATSGEVTTVTVLDYERKEPKIGPCKLTVEVAEGQLSAKAILTVTVNDVNERHVITNLPNTTTVSAPTATTGNTVFGVLIEEIEDLTLSTYTYSILNTDPPNGPFTMDPATGVLTLTADLTDWVSPLYYELTIHVTDPDHVAGPETLAVLIEDVRLAPYIDNLDASISLPEDSTDGTTVLFQVVTAHVGGDTRGDPLNVTLEQTYPKDNDIFAVTLGGDVTHKMNPGFDYFGVRRYDLEIEARDFDGLHTSERKNLSVHITWVNQPPYHQVALYSTTIPEDTPLQSPLPGVMLQPMDRDVPMGDWVTFTIAGTGSHLFRADNTTCLVYVTSDLTLDPGATSVTYGMDVHVVDSHGESGSASLQVTVTDVNNHRPSFYPTSYSGQIKGSSVGGTPTGVAVVATDDDGGKNAQITFSILEAEASLYFQVDSAGIVTGKQPIDFATQPNFTFTVVAKDGGTPSLSDTATVFIEVTEVNAHAPYFDPRFISLDVRSDSFPGAHVYTVVSQDRDNPATVATNVVYYEIALDPKFDVVNISGDVTVSAILAAGDVSLLLIGADDRQDQRLFADALSLRIDVYSAQRHSVAITLDTSIDEFIKTQDAFLDQLSILLEPWHVGIQEVRAENERTVVEVYAVESGLAYQEEYSDVDKVFVDKKDVMERLRTDMYGSPNEALRSPAFSAWSPTQVAPAEPVWIVDTPEGIGVLALVCLLAAGGVTTLLVVLARKCHWCCYGNSPPTNLIKPTGKPHTGNFNEFRFHKKMSRGAKSPDPATSANKPRDSPVNTDQTSRSPRATLSEGKTSPPGGAGTHSHPPGPTPVETPTAPRPPTQPSKFTW